MCTHHNCDLPDFEKLGARIVIAAFPKLDGEFEYPGAITAFASLDRSDALRRC
jgi:hypothetical protein